MALVLLIAISANLVSVFARTDVAPDPGFHVSNHTYLDVYSSAISRAHYNPWVCNYFREPGYRCLTCNQAIHCYPGNFALLVQCAGMFPYCRNGYCARFKVVGCTDDQNIVENAENHSTSSGPTLPPYVAGGITINKNKTEPTHTLADDVDSAGNEDTGLELSDVVQVESQPIVIT